VTRGSRFGLLVAGAILGATMTACGRVAEVRHHSAQTVVASDGAERRLSDARIRQATRMQRAVIACMNRAGFKYTPAVPAANPRDSLSPRQDPLRYGYGVNTAPVLQQARDPNASYVAALTPARRAGYHHALEGGHRGRSPPGGCIGVGYDHYMRSLAAVLADFETARERMYAQLAADPRIVRVEHAWAACMSRSGYRYPTVQSIIESLTRAARVDGSLGSPSARAHELAIARVDSDCRDRYIQPTYQATLADYLTREAPNDQRLLAQAVRAVGPLR
jgi:hypothetical protein